MRDAQLNELNGDIGTNTYLHGQDRSNFSDANSNENSILYEDGQEDFSCSDVDGEDFIIPLSHLECINQDKKLVFDLLANYEFCVLDKKSAYTRPHNYLIRIYNIQYPS